MSEDKKFELQTRSNNSVQLHNNGLEAGSLISQSISRLSDHQKSELLAKAGEEALRLEVKDRSQAIDEAYGRRAIQDHIDAVDMLKSEGKLTRQKVISSVKTGAGDMKIESKSGATCFVASVAFEDPNHPQVMFLRNDRDTVLKKSALGRQFIRWYWLIGPRVAKVVDHSKSLKKLSRILISAIIKLLK
jgi:hypothetical protein